MKKTKMILAAAIAIITVIAVFSPLSSAKYVGRSNTDYMVTFGASAVFIAAKTPITIPKNGYYYIEAWGGNGGDGGSSIGGSLGSGYGGTGGTAQPQTGLFYFQENDKLYIQAGPAGAIGGTIGSNSGTGAAGGTAATGLYFGSGYSGGNGGNGYGSYVGGGGGGAGGAASGVLLNGTNPSNIIIASGGGGGAGAGAGAGDGGNGGNSGVRGLPNSASGNHGAGGNAWLTGSTDAYLHNTNRHNGQNGGFAQRGGGGAGGGGGGWNGATGGGAESGQAGTNGSTSYGGGGAGGMGSVAAIVPAGSSGRAANPGFSTLPLNSRPTTNDGGYVVGNGYVVITYLGQTP